MPIKYWQWKKNSVYLIVIDFFSCRCFCATLEFYFKGSICRSTLADLIDFMKLHHIYAVRFKWKFSSIFYCIFVICCTKLKQTIIEKEMDMTNAKCLLAFKLNSNSVAHILPTIHQETLDGSCNYNLSG